MKVSMENDKNFGNEKITILVDVFIFKLFSKEDNLFIFKLFLKEDSIFIFKLFLKEDNIFIFKCFF